MERTHIRLDIVTKQWVIFAPARGKRPHDFVRAEAERAAVPDYREDCPFCPGNEDRLSSILLEMPHPSGGTWQTRVIPNKFPAVTPDGEPVRSIDGIYTRMEGFGRHEVIIESPIHNRHIALMDPQEAATVIETYHRRYTEIMKDDAYAMVVIFRNHGERAGTSLIHPHSQLIALGWAPRHLRLREYEAQEYYDHWGRCIYCDMLHVEMEDRRRSLFENSRFFAFVPYAAEVPFEVWIVPKDHKADFGDADKEERTELAVALRNILARLNVRLHDPDYNYMIHTAPRYKSDEPHLHYFLRIRPRLTTQAGFEIGSGIGINPSLPEADTDFLRASVSMDESETV